MTPSVPPPSGPIPAPGIGTAAPDRLQRAGQWFIVGLAILLFLLRWLGPSNLTDNDQERPASYILDAAVNGHWLVQRDWTDDLTSKPPFYTWLGGMATRALGPGLAALYLPCALALVTAALLIHATTATVAGPRPAFLAGFFVLANPLSAKLVALARTDPVFTATVAATATLAFHALRSGRGWGWAGLAAALATLTKGPLGIVLGFAGFAGVLFQPDESSGIRRPRVRNLLVCVVLPLGIAGAWFLLAWMQTGQPLIDKMLKAELVSHAIGERGTVPGQGLILAPAYFLGRFAPWSLLAVLGLWEAWKRPHPEPDARAWQRFAAAWLVLGLAVFGLASHQRGDLIAPLLPAGAVLAAFPVARWSARWSSRALGGVAGILGLALAIGSQIQHASHSRPVFADTRGLRELAGRFRAAGGQPDALVHTDTPYALQFFLGTMSPIRSHAAAAEALSRAGARFVAVADRQALERALGPDAVRLRTVAAWPETNEPRYRIVTLDPAPTNPPPPPAPYP